MTDRPRVFIKEQFSIEEMGIESRMERFAVMEAAEEYSEACIKNEIIGGIVIVGKGS